MKISYSIFIFQFSCSVCLVASNQYKCEYHLERQKKTWAGIWRRMAKMSSVTYWMNHVAVLLPTHSLSVSSSLFLMLSLGLFCSQSLRKVGQDSTVLLICITVFLSYLPEAGQYSSFFLYLRQVHWTRFYIDATKTHDWNCFLSSGVADLWGCCYCRWHGYALMFM